MILLISVSPRWIPSWMVSLRRSDRCWRALECVQHVISSILTPSIQLKKNSPKILFNGRNKWNHAHWCKQQCKRCNKNTLERNSSSLVCLLTLHFHVIASYLMSTGAWSPVASQHCSCRQLRLHHRFCWLNYNIAVLCDHLMRVTFMNPHYAFFRDHDGYSTFFHSLFCHWWSRLCIPVLG